MYLPSRLQKYCVTGRLLSFVMGLAASKGSSVRLTQTLRVPLNGLTNAMNFPSGEICAPEISGSPKKSSRSISGGRPFCCARAGAPSISKQNNAKITARNGFVLEDVYSIKTSFILSWLDTEISTKKQRDTSSPGSGFHD